MSVEGILRAAQSLNFLIQFFMSRQFFLEKFRGLTYYK